MKKVYGKIIAITILFVSVFVFADTFNNEQTLIEKISKAKTNKQQVLSNRNLLSYYMNQKNYEKAFPVCEQMFRLKLSKKQKYYLYMDAAVTYQNLGHVEDSIEYFKEAEYLYPKKIDPKIMLGKIYFQNALYELAKNKFYEALQIDIKSVTASIWLGDIYRVQSNFKTALEHYEYAQKLRDKLDITVYLHIAEAAKELGLTDKAVTILEKIYKSDHRKDISLMLASLYKEQGRYKDAEEKLSYLINNANVKDIELYANLAALYIFSREYEKAEKLLLDFKNSNKTNDNREVIDLLLAEVYFSLSEKDAAEQLLKEVMNYTSSDYIKLHTEHFLKFYK
ncbi:MAG: tetratricopeptide repeat protein [Endomicrobiaceae bacterium]